MFQEEIFVAPTLEARVVGFVDRVERALAGGVEVHRVVDPAVVGGQIHAAAEPGQRRPVGRLRDEHAHVHVHRRYVRVARMQHQRHAHGLERRSGQFGTVLGGRRRQARAAHRREVAAAALEQRAVLDHAAGAVALQRRVRRTGPRVAPEAGAAVGALEGLEDAGLQAQQIVADLALHRVLLRGLSAAQR
ncbi:hypothetical protein GALL_298380 [mine drainage metagenome]|uniref:Uncharacterized protein n=1 Tax=mine drainage metagenome TaxID=410659 RepID=A0A1J5RJE2_9ZZZZ